MYPEEVYQCGLPLPYELLRPIAFQAAYEYIKENLKFPTRRRGLLGPSLLIKDNEEESVFFHWYESTDTHNITYYTTQVIHRNYGDIRVHERKYYSLMTNLGYQSHVIFCIPTDLLTKFISHV